MYLGREEKEKNCSLGGGGGEGEQLWIGRGAEGDYWERWRTTVVI